MKTVDYWKILTVHAKWWTSNEKDDTNKIGQVWPTLVKKVKSGG